MNIDKQLEILRESPLLNAALASKELFHSNFLAWLICLDEFQEPMFELFARRKMMGKLSVAREKKHVDLLLKDGSGLIIIENKVKDVVQDKQLQKIEDDQVNEKSEKQFVILCIKSPALSANRKAKWRIVSYKDLLAALTKVEAKDPYHRFLVNDYIQMVSAMSDIIDTVSTGETYNFFPCPENKVAVQLQGVRLHDLYYKYNSSRLVDFVQAHLSNENYDEFTFVTGWTINSNQPCMDFFLKKDSVVIGIQIQGGTYRKILETDNTKGASERLSASGIWFSTSWTSKSGLPFLSYESSRIFRYQYRDLPFGISFKELADGIGLDLAYVCKNQAAILDACRG